MKFNYADMYKDSPEHYLKFKLLDNFLEKLSNENPEEFAKDLYTSEKFMAIGVGSSDIIYTPHTEMPEHIEKQIRKELLRLYPKKMNFKEAKEAIFEYFEFTNPHMADGNPPHFVESCIFAPKGSDKKTLETIYTRIKEDNLSNEDVILDMGLSNTDMRLFLVILLKGSNWIVSLENYSDDNPFGVTENAGG